LAGHVGGQDDHGQPRQRRPSTQHLQQAQPEESVQVARPGIRKQDDALRGPDVGRFPLGEKLCEARGLVAVRAGRGDRRDNGLPVPASDIVEQ
jgi:hypothetical protein